MAPVYWVSFKSAHILFAMPLMLGGMVLQTIGMELQGLSEGLDGVFHEWFLGGCGCEDCKDDKHE
jgi:hypothetical protein